MKKEEFLRRMFLYRLQYVIGGICALFIWLMLLGVIFAIEVLHEIGGIFLFSGPVLIFSLFNTFTYFWSKRMSEIYGIEMFADLDQEWLKEHQGFDSQAFGDIFARLIQCRKIAGPYMLAVIVPLAFIHMGLAVIVGYIYLIGYMFYHETYFEDAISYKIPRVFGGHVIVSKVLGENEEEEK